MQLHRVKQSLLTILVLAFTGFAFGNNPEASRILVHMLNYMGKDYPNAVANGKVINKDEYAEQMEFCENTEKYFREFSAQWSDSDSVAVGIMVDDLINQVHQKADPNLVAQKARAVKEKVIGITGLKTYPTQYPSLENGQKVYVANCQKCHGAKGLGDGPDGDSLNPKPRNFMDDKLMSVISPSHAFNTVRLGVQGTGMRAHPDLEDEDVWDVAFFVVSLRYQNKGKATNIPLTDTLTLEKIAVSSDNDLAAEFGYNKEQLGNIRLDQPKVSNDHFLKTADDYLLKTLDAYTHNNVSDAAKYASFAYLEGVEPIEPQLRDAAPEVFERLESQMQAVSKMIAANRGETELADSINAARQTIVNASKLLQKKEYSFWLALLMSVSILLREGLEAFLVIMVILSILKTANIPYARTWVHAGWIVAVLIGIVLWFLSGKVLSAIGGSKELVEGVVSVIAVLILLYIGFWLHGKSEIGKWKQYVSTLLKHAANDGSLFGMAALSFFVVFREVFESVLFLSALKIEAGEKQTHAIALGFVLAFVIVMVFAAVVLRFSAKLPIPKLFKISSWVMGLLAFVLVGKGIGSFQEIYYLPAHPFPVPEIELLGISPTVETCTAQLIVLIIVVLIMRRKTGGSAPKTA